MRYFPLFILMLGLVACSGEPSAQERRQAGSSSHVVGYAKTLLGTRYHYGGDSPRTGFDCSGFVRHVFLHVRKLNLPHNALGISRYGDKIDEDELQQGDLVFYNTLDENYSHVGIYIGNRRFIHAPSSGKRVEVVDMEMKYWRTRYNGARRL